MTLDELERLSKAATPGPWVYEQFGDYLWRLTGGTPLDQDGAPTAIEARCAAEDQIKFVAAMRNHFDSLLEIARAAEDCAFYYGGDEYSGPIKRLKSALAKLEGK